MTRNETTGRIALVTGANKGIGLETARQLAAAGHRVLIGARDAERGAAAAAGIPGARHVSLDVTDEESVAAAAKWIEQEYGVLDALVNNAGITSGLATPSGTTVADFRVVYETNVIGLVAVTNAVLPLLRRSASARIVNVSSELGSLAMMSTTDGQPSPFPVLLAYNSSKSAVNAITVMYAAELADTGIKVNAVSPGHCATDLNHHQGALSAATGAEVPVRAATLPDDGPTGTFFSADGPIPW